MIAIFIIVSCGGCGGIRIRSGPDSGASSFILIASSAFLGTTEIQFDPGTIRISIVAMAIVGAVFYKVVGGMIRSPGNGGQHIIIVTTAGCCVAAFSLVVGDDGFLRQLFPPIAAVLGERHNNS